MMNCYKLLKVSHNSLLYLITLRTGLRSEQRLAAFVDVNRTADTVAEVPLKDDIRSPNLHRDGPP